MPSPEFHRFTQTFRRLRASERALFGEVLLFLHGCPRPLARRLFELWHKSLPIEAQARLCFELQVLEARDEPTASRERFFELPPADAARFVRTTGRLVGTEVPVLGEMATKLAGQQLQKGKMRTPRSRS